jgi:hypothetical protein
MKYLIILMLVLFVGFLISVKIAISQNEKIKKYKEEIEKNNEVKNVYKEINKKIKSINDFNNSINILSDYSKNK